MGTSGEGTKRHGPPPRGAVEEVAVIVPAYRSRAFLPACLASLEAQEGVNPSLVVADNASGDGTAEYVRRRHPGVRVMEAVDNRGFAAAVNLGLSAAGKAPFIALVNPDTEASPAFLARLAAALRDTPEAGIAAARMMLVEPAGRIDNLGTAVTSGFGQVSIGHGLEALPGFEERRFVPAACGGGMMIRREVLHAAGGFDEDYFLCWEDVEFCLRAFRRGFRCVFEPGAEILHHKTAHMGHHSPLNVYHYCRGALPTARKCLSRSAFLRLLPRILAARCRTLLLFAGRGRLGAALRGEAAGWRLALRGGRKGGGRGPSEGERALRELLREGDRLRRCMKQAAARAARGQQE